jgi:hypothetical protein
VLITEVGDRVFLCGRFILGIRRSGSECPPSARSHASSASSRVSPQDKSSAILTSWDSPAAVDESTNSQSLAIDTPSGSGMSSVHPSGLSVMVSAERGRRKTQSRDEGKPCVPPWSNFPIKAGQFGAICRFWLRAATLSMRCKLALLALSGTLPPCRARHLLDIVHHRE